MGKRLLSPSAINLYKQCPRRYYYRYIERLKTADSIHLIRGSIVHEVLEHLYDVDVRGKTYESIFTYLGKWMLHKLRTLWDNDKERLLALDLSEDQLVFYFDESRVMLRHFLQDFIRKLEKTGLPLEEAFEKIKPLREEKMVCEKHNVMGFIDVVEMVNDKIIRVVDYKTSAKDKLTDDYQLQLAIYALLIYETYGYPPEEVVINFLKFGERSLKVDQELMDFAAKECALVTEKTQSKNIVDYPVHVTPLCKWENARGSGQCDFYDTCIKQRTQSDLDSYF